MFWYYSKGTLYFIINTERAHNVNYLIVSSVN